jgi:hypothetical protein
MSGFIITLLTLLIVNTFRSIVSASLGNSQASHQQSDQDPRG